MRKGSTGNVNRIEEQRKCCACSTTPEVNNAKGTLLAGRCIAQGYLLADWTIPLNIHLVIGKTSKIISFFRVFHGRIGKMYVRSPEVGMRPHQMRGTTLELGSSETVKPNDERKLLGVHVNQGGSCAPESAAHSRRFLKGRLALPR